MWHALSIALGASLALIGLWDQFWTILGEGGGPVTRRIAKRIFGSARWLYARYPRSRVLSVGGVASVLGTVVFWVVVQWTAWTLIFVGLPEGVVAAGSSEPAGLAERVYFAGYTLSTLGIGDVQPRGAVARVLTAAASFNGLVQISFAVGYLVPIIVAATDKRRVSIWVSCLGESSTDVLVNLWDGRSLDPLPDLLRSLTPELALLEQRHLSYPILPYLHSHERSGSIGCSLAVLDDTISLVTMGVDSDQLDDGSALPPGVLHAFRRALSTLVETLATASEQDGTSVPEPPSLGPLRRAGIPTVDDETFRWRIARLAERRRTLHRLVRMDGWEWAEVLSSDSDQDHEELTSLYDTESV